MAKSKYKEKILEKLRIIHAEEEMLYAILKEVAALPEEDKDDGDNDASDR